MNNLSLVEMVDKTGKRKAAFEIMISHVRKAKYPLIVETGVSRQENNFDGDGMSTLIWDSLATETNGTVHAVDINPDNCTFVKKYTGNRTLVFCGDSITFLNVKELEFQKLSRSIDLLYLDSYDLDIDDWHPSAMHHLMELLAIKGALKENSTMICVDDNLLINGENVGKGTYVADAMKRLGKREIYNGYQRMWMW